MGKIGYGYGSEWHLLRYLGYHRHLLESKVLAETGGTRLDWLDFNFSPTNLSLKQDSEIKGLAFLPKEIQNKWGDFWPQTGNVPNWDAVGKLETNNGSEWLLVEAKAHLEELQSHCGAESPSREKILLSFIESKQSYGAGRMSEKNWMSPYYQFCNRLAILHFLNNQCNPSVHSHLLFVNFYGDNIPNAVCPRLKEEWLGENEKMYQHCGIDKNSELWNRVHTIFLPTNPIIENK